MRLCGVLGRSRVSLQKLCLFGKPGTPEANAEESIGCRNCGRDQDDLIHEPGLLFQDWQNLFLDGLSHFLGLALFRSDFDYACKHEGTPFFG